MQHQIRLSVLFDQSVLCGSESPLLYACKLVTGSDLIITNALVMGNELFMLIDNLSFDIETARTRLEYLKSVRAVTVEPISRVAA